MPLIGPTRISWLASALLLAACSSPTPTAPIAGIELRPAGARFVRTSDGAVKIPYTVRNVGTASVLLTDRCGDFLTPAVERREGAKWVVHSGGFCLTSVDMSAVPLAAGARRNEVEIVSAAPAGQFRLVLGTELGPVVSTTFAVQ